MTSFVPQRSHENLLRQKAPQTADVMKAIVQWSRSNADHMGFANRISNTKRWRHSAFLTHKRTTKVQYTHTTKALLIWRPGNETVENGSETGGEALPRSVLRLFRTHS